MERSAIGVETFPPLDGMLTSVADPPEDCSPLPTNPHPHHHHQQPPTTGRGLGGGAPKGAGGTGWGRRWGAGRASERAGREGAGWR